MVQFQSPLGGAMSPLAPLDPPLAGQRWRCPTPEVGTYQRVQSKAQECTIAAGAPPGYGLDAAQDFLLGMHWRIRNVCFGTLLGGMQR